MINTKNTKALITIATLDHLSQALVMLDSAKTYDDYDYYKVFIIDLGSKELLNLSQSIQEKYSWVELFCPECLDENLKKLFFKATHYYNVFELSCFSKYLGVLHTIQTHSDIQICVFSDADVLFYSSLNQEFLKLNNKAIYLTPHQLRPSTDVAEYEYLLSGWINAGFFIVNNNHLKTLEILEWLIMRISMRGFFATKIGLNCDQTWLSLMPALFFEYVEISRDPGCNVAYWNLSERNLVFNNNQYLSGNEPLKFFHFSGFTMAKKGYLSKHSNFSFTKGSVIYRLTLHYQKSLNKFDYFNNISYKRFSFTKKGLKQRILICSEINEINIECPTNSRGFFTKLGSRLDFLLKIK